MRLWHAAVALGLGITALCLADSGCTPDARARAAAEAQARVNAYCDARQKALVALGVDGSPAVWLGEAGATQ